MKIDILIPEWTTWIIFAFIVVLLGLNIYNKILTIKLNKAKHKFEKTKKELRDTLSKN
jgi:predicted Holliday junction resolvase-like endonuclease